MRKLRLLTSIACLVAATSANALEASLPSQLVSLLARGSCPFFITDAFDTRVNGDGTVTNFVIPKGEVLVVTDVSIVRNAAGLTPGGTAQAQLVIGTVAHPGLVFAENITVGTSGAITVHATFPTGIVVKQGSIICPVARDLTGSSTNLTAGGTLHGFLTADH